MAAHDMQERVGDAYQLYFLEDQESKPVAVVLPTDATQLPPTALPEVMGLQYAMCMHACRCSTVYVRTQISAVRHGCSQALAVCWGAL